MDYGYYFQFILSLIFIIGLILAFSLVAKRMGFAQTTLLRGNKNKRIHVKEVRPLDAKRKVIIIQCDEKEHVLLIGGTNDVLLDSFASLPETEEKLETKPQHETGKLEKKKVV